MNWRDLVKQRLVEVGMTQDQLAEHLGMTQGGLGHWLTGKRQPPFEKVGQIADLLRIPRAVMGAALLDAGAPWPAAEPAAASVAPARPAVSAASIKRRVQQLNEVGRLDLLKIISDVLDLAPPDVVVTDEELPASLAEPVLHAPSGETVSRRQDIQLNRDAIREDASEHIKKMRETKGDKAAPKKSTKVE